MDDFEAANEYYESEALHRRKEARDNCECQMCEHDDQPVDPELDLETRLDIVEVGLNAVRMQLNSLMMRIELLRVQNDRR